MTGHAAAAPAGSPAGASEATEPLRILVVRADRIGDVVLSTPVFAALRRDYPGARVTALVQAPVAPLLRGLSTIDELMIYEPLGAHRGLRGFFRLLSELRARRFRIAIVLQVRFALALAAFLAGIRYRVGPYSRFYSWALFNRGVRQRRSRVEMHEADYNLQLLRRIGVRTRTRTLPTAVSVSDEARRWASEFLGAQDVSGGARIAVNPGMGGSALNWPEGHWLELLRALVREGRPVLVTGGPVERELLGRLREGLGADAARALWYSAAPGDDVDRLAALFERCAVVVAPSTGPLHVAVALGRPTVSFFPPIRVQSALRWGPYVGDESRAAALVPEVFCGEDFSCRGPKCHYYPCMRTVGVTQALGEVTRLARAPSGAESG
jgi:heptosyltransferase-3